MIDYDHGSNVHTAEGPRAALPLILGGRKPGSLLDVGCGTGTWLAAALEFGVKDIFGVDGVAIPPEQMRIPARLCKHVDLTKPLDLGRRFDCVLCLEVAEHLDASTAGILIASLARHSDLVIFSAACPGQPGQHHVNCQWPAYWQDLFNERGYACSEDARWNIWNDSRIESWYRQNLFIAQRDPGSAGNEPRLRPVIHPAIFEASLKRRSGAEFPEHLLQIEQGRMPTIWYWTLPFRAAVNKIRRRLSGVRTITTSTDGS